MGSAPLVRPPFVECDDFVENAFQRRFQGIVLESLRDRKWRLVAARPGDGKSRGIADLITRSKELSGQAAHKRRDGRTRMPLLNAQAPNNRTTERALGVSLAAGFGVVPHMPWDEFRPWLLNRLVTAGTRLIIADDAHSLSLEHLQYLKELTDTLAAPPYHRPVGLVFVAVSDGETVPLEEYLTREGEFWEQFRRRFATGGQFLFVRSLSVQEMVDVCDAYRDKYRPLFPDLDLVPWAKRMHSWLTRPELDPVGAGRVTMNNVRECITLALKAAYVLGRSDVDGALIDGAGLALTATRGAKQDIDDDPDDIDDILRRDIDGDWPATGDDGDGELEGGE